GVQALDLDVEGAHPVEDRGHQLALLALAHPRVTEHPRGQGVELPETLVVQRRRRLAEEEELELAGELRLETHLLAALDHGPEERARAGRVRPAGAVTEVGEDADGVRLPRDLPEGGDVEDGVSVGVPAVPAGHRSVVVEDVRDVP